MFWHLAEGVRAWVRKDESCTDQSRSISATNDELRAYFTKGMESIVEAYPYQLRNRGPEYPPAGKRILQDKSTWLKTLKRDDFQLIIDSITVVTETGIATKAGENYDMDVLIYGTRFYPSRML